MHPLDGNYLYLLFYYNALKPIVTIEFKIDNVNN